MRLNSVIISSFFVSVVLAAPGRERHLFRVADTQLPHYVAGKMLIINDGQGEMQSVSSTIHVPDIAGQKSGFYAAAVVGLEGAFPCNNTLRLGVVFQVGDAGPSYKVQYEHDDTSIPFPEIDVKTGDEIQLIAYANLMQGSVKVVNLRNNQNVTHQFSLTENLCGMAASWLVQVADASMSLGTLIFANYEVGGRDFDSTHLDSEILNIVKDGNLLTNTSADGHSVTVKWL